MNREIEIFIDKYTKEMIENNVAIFIGAGFSKSVGYVDWKGLLKDVAYELNLDIERETDLVSLAQYYYNKHRNKHEISQIIFQEFTKEKEISNNHKILARLPIFTYWTTNYDSLIEDSLKEIQKVVDVKYNNKQLSLTKPKRDAIVYKMHGDKEHTDDSVIIKDDYEMYYRKYAPFITALNGDLISKTFLFIGFSFNDPNLDYILSRIRVEYGSENSRTHYAIIKRVNETEYTSTTDYEYEKRKQELFIEDLKRYKIQALQIENYSEITIILRLLEKKINQNNIFVSGSAETYGRFNINEATTFIHNLSKELIKANYNIISGFGLGIGSSVITGALEEIYMQNKKIDNERLLLRPFPQGILNEETRMDLWTKYRQDMISRSGISIFIFGNKIDKDGNVTTANGVLEEFRIAKEYTNIIVPVGCTGFVAKDIWNEVKHNFDDYYKNSSTALKELFEKLNINTIDSNDLIVSIIQFINEAKKCALKIEN